MIYQPERNLILYLEIVEGKGRRNQRGPCRNQ